MTTTSTPVSPDQIIRSAEAAIQRGQPMRGFAALRSVLDASPGHPAANLTAARAMAAQKLERAALGYVATAAGATVIAPQIANTAQPIWAQLARRRAGAADPAERAVLANPQSLPGWVAMSQALRNSARNDAESAARRAIALQPKNWRGYACLAEVYGAGGAAAASEAAFRRGIERAPGGAVDLSARLALQLIGQRRFSDALDVLGAHLEAGRDHHDFQNALAAAHERIGDLAAARAAFDQAVAVNPPGGPAPARLLEFLWRLNDLDGIEALLEHLEDIDPSDREVAQARLVLERGDAAGAIERLEAADQKDLSPRQRARLRFMLGQACEKAGRPEEAFKAFSDGNALDESIDNGRQRFRPDAMRQLLARSRSVYSSPVSRPAEPKADEAIARHAFVVGFPRSGTTLIDMMLSGHDDAATMEEAPHASAALASLGLVQGKRPAESGAEAVAAARRLYIEAVSRELGADSVASKMIVDRHAAIAGWTGQLAELFPGAQWAVVIRHPYDVVLSSFMQPFQPDPLNTNFRALDTAAEAYDHFMGAHFEAAQSMGLNVHEVRYETLVAEPEAQLRALLDHLGLEWTDAVLDHQRQAASRDRVNTASHAQVTRPLYTQARYRWRKYAFALGPVMERLKPWAERLGYEG
ncbi:MAG: sulfotransferase [Pseudomonadota bacterium]